MAEFHQALVLFRAHSFHTLVGNLLPAVPLCVPPGPQGVCPSFRDENWAEGGWEAGFPRPAQLVQSGPVCLEAQV